MYLPAEINKIMKCYVNDNLGYPHIIMLGVRRKASNNTINKVYHWAKGISMISETKYQIVYASFLWKQAVC